MTLHCRDAVPRAETGVDVDCSTISPTLQLTWDTQTRDMETVSKLHMPNDSFQDDVLPGVLQVRNSLVKVNTL
jgi:hypothetical protein